MFDGEDDLEDDQNNNTEMDEKKRDRSSDEDGSDRELPNKVYRCEKPDCKDFNRIFQFASQKVRHDG